MARSFVFVYIFACLEAQKKKTFYFKGYRKGIILTLTRLGLTFRRTNILSNCLTVATSGLRERRRREDVRRVSESERRKRASRKCT